VRTKHLNIEYYPSFITTLAYDRFPIFEDNRVAEILRKAIYFNREKGFYDLVAFVIMPEHLHMILIPKNHKNVSQIMHSLKSFSSKEINATVRKTGPIWQKGFRDFTIGSQKVLMQKINYIHENPVRRGIVDKPEDYLYSTADNVNEHDLAKYLV
jgi:REP element-mobilizing transposase RayT